MASSAVPDGRPIGWGGKLVLALGALVVAGLGCEVLARVAYPAPPTPGREPQLMFQMRSDLGFLHVPNQRGYLDDGLATINALGLRGAEPEVPKPEGMVRILAVGDSTTFGWGVDDDGTYEVQLERLLRADQSGRRVEVVNGGVANYDLERDAGLLRHFGPMLQPDVVLVGFYWNDLPYERMAPDAEPPVGLGRPDQSRGVGGVVPSHGATFRFAEPPTGLNRLLRSSRALYVLRHAWLAFEAPTDRASRLMQWEMALLEGRESPAIDAAWADVRATLAGIRRFADAHGYDIGVVLPPIRAQVEQDYPQAAYQDRVRAMAEAFGMFVVDPLPLFKAEADPSRLFIPFDRIHLTAEGNAVLARAAFDVLRERRVFTEDAE